MARLLGAENARGRFTFYARIDLAFLLDLAARCRPEAGDQRADGLDEGLAEVLQARRGPFGLWEHPAHPQLSRWLTLDLDTSLRRLGTAAAGAAPPRKA